MLHVIFDYENLLLFYAGFAQSERLCLVLPFSTFKCIYGAGVFHDTVNFEFIGLPQEKKLT